MGTIIFVGPDSTEALRNFLAAWLPEGRTAWQKTVKEQALEIDDFRSRALARSFDFASREQDRCPEAELILAFEAFPQFDTLGPFMPGMIIDPKNQRELECLLETIAGASYTLCYAVTARFAGMSESWLTSTSEVIGAEITMTKDPKPGCISRSEFLESGPGRPFHGYFRRYLSDPEVEEAFLFSKVSAWIRRECSSRSLRGVFRSKACG